MDICAISMSEKDASRFWRKVKKGAGAECWEWNSWKHNGYGRFSVNNRGRMAHRISYTLLVGIIPDGKLVCHHCDNPGCVRPDHLFVGTQTDNMRDARKKGRMNYDNMFGENHPRAKLTDAKVVQIKNLIQAERPHAEIAEKFGVAYSVISNIKMGYLWAHVVV